MFTLFVGAALAAPLQELPPSRLPVDAAIVPGCPSNDDGTLSDCQWRRALWAHHLYATGLVDRLIVSGNAAYNPYVEADALAAGLRALGVPDDRILREPRALHTDENIAYALLIADEHGLGDVVVASDLGQAPGGCLMVREWSRDTRECYASIIDYRWLRARLASGLPVVRTDPVPADEWLPLEEREAQIAAVTGERPRRSSLSVYLSRSVRALVGTSEPPAPPPPLPRPSPAATAAPAPAGGSSATAGSR